MLREMLRGGKEIFEVLRTRPTVVSVDLLSAGLHPPGVADGVTPSTLLVLVHLADSLGQFGDRHHRGGR